jgi:DNA modification methylase
VTTEATNERLALYLKFLRSKAVTAVDRGLVGDFELNPRLFPHQRDIAAWAIRGGNRAIFAAFGLGKSLIQIQIQHVILGANPGGSGLIVCPLGVKAEFVRDAREFFGIDYVYVRTDQEWAEFYAQGHRYFLTNYERVRDGQLDPNLFTVVSLDEASILRSFGSKTYQTFLTLFDKVQFKFVATATPSPNRFKELIHYAAFLGVMDSGQALTRFFKRDSEEAGNLQLHPHKAREFYLWLNTWAVFLNKPSELGHSDAGYDLQPLKIIRHRIPVDHSTAGYDSWGQGKLIRDAALSLPDACREKRDSLQDRVAVARKIIEDGGPDRNWLVWHDLEAEREALDKAIPEIVSIWGSQDLEIREKRVKDFSEGRIRIFGTKPRLSGSGCNLQRHCYSAIFLGIGWKFNDFYQAIARIQRFLQTHEVEIHLIYTESEDSIHDDLMRKWEQDIVLRAKMAGVLAEFGLNPGGAVEEMCRQISLERRAETGDLFTAVNRDNVFECFDLPDNSVDLIVTSVPFSDHYEYTELYNDFGHNDGDEGFFTQMEFLTPELLRILQPGRMCCVHAKDRLVYGSVSGDGMYTVNEFSDKCVAAFKKHGFRYCGRISIDTDVVRENGQTYRLGWTENSKDGTKMGVGSPEYVLLFRKLPTDTKNAYADIPVVKSKDDYTRSRWQFDASSFWRSRGDRFLSPEEIQEMTSESLAKLWKSYSASHVYDYEQHVGVAQSLEDKGLLPASFMLLPPVVKSPWMWDDVMRARTLNMEQSRKRQEFHVCPLQLDIIDRLIGRYSNPGDLVLDPFAGIGSVPYRAILKGRRGYGIELSPQYWKDGVAYCKAAEQKVSMPTLFDLIATEEEPAA